MDTTTKVYLDLSTNEVYESPSFGCIEIDALICPAIQDLNRKGYITSACCCGHDEDLRYMESNHAYIQFDFGGITPEHLPLGWYWTDNGQQMEYEYQSQEEKALHMEIISVIDRLKAWAAKLPDTRG